MRQPWQAISAPLLGT